jgi:hypothetical protein
MVAADFRMSQVFSTTDFAAIDVGMCPTQHGVLSTSVR